MNDFVLQTFQLTKYYHKTPALDHLNLCVPKGCVYGLLGRNGSGKTTAIKLILGLLAPTAGRAEVFGHPSDNLPPSLRSRIGYITEGHHLERWMTIRELEHFQKAFYPDQWDRRFFAEMLDYFELSPKRKIKTLSNGQRAQVNLALTLAANPELLIMDDPMLGLDAAVRRQFLEGMVHLIQKEGRTILFSSHILSDVERVADRIAVIDKGVLRADCTLEEFRMQIRKYLFEFPQPNIPVDTLPGLIYSKRNQQMLEATVVKTPEEAIYEWARRHQAAVEPVPMSIEDQFIEFTGPKQARKLFSWEMPV
ncbi:MAG TPA: ABC transporter ATP-binding protein [Anaerohalosphaeraceae bacterium]|nr:ABC transporter ATP-binding protein [Anaerohalosphaeraceae bacterium]HOL89012.1 ABC transporter ATP-binding protein [Anaerohalosphaeraceae bacterium]HPP56463.1 ABC transporter ATP-binding protein [Anaerohalosphaeraceae bacterium]